MIAEAFLVGKIAAAGDPEVYQVIVHVGTDVITSTGTEGAVGVRAAALGDPAGVSAETPAIGKHDAPSRSPSPGIPDPRPEP